MLSSWTWPGTDQQLGRCRTRLPVAPGETGTRSQRVCAWPSAARSRCVPCTSSLCPRSLCLLQPKALLLTPFVDRGHSSQPWRGNSVPTVHRRCCVLMPPAGAHLLSGALQTRAAGRHTDSRGPSPASGADSGISLGHRDAVTAQRSRLRRSLETLSFCNQKASLLLLLISMNVSVQMGPQSQKFIKLDLTRIKTLMSIKFAN